MSHLNRIPKKKEVSTVSAINFLKKLRKGRFQMEAEKCIENLTELTDGD